MEKQFVRPQNDAAVASEAGLLKAGLGSREQRKQFGFDGANAVDDVVWHRHIARAKDEAVACGLDACSYGGEERSGCAAGRQALSTLVRAASQLFANHASSLPSPLTISQIAPCTVH
jgi:hypothetical protein